MDQSAVSLSTIPDDVSLLPISRRPTVLSPQTVAAAMRLVPPSQAPAASVQTSIIIVTHNGEMFTRLCLASLIANTEARTSEIIVIDNASIDQTVCFLKSLSQIRLITNETNRGFAAANNQGLAIARGKFLVLLNNDTIVPPGWLTTLQSHLKSPDIGMVGPVTNRAQNESKIQTHYNTYGQFLDFARQRRREFSGRSFDIPMLMMFAVAMRREVFEAAGPLDEAFGLGMFEDDDYAQRLRSLGYRLICAQDCFVHHFGQGSFGNLTASGEFNRIFDRNRSYFEQKWNITWKPHQPAAPQDHGPIADAVNLLICEPGMIAVISHGDENVLSMLAGQNQTAKHFPPQANAHHPLNGCEALLLLRDERAAGACYLLIPSHSFWWLEFYTEFATELNNNCRRLEPPDGCCVIFDLSSLPAKRVMS